MACASGRSDVQRGVKFTLDTLCPLHGATKPLVVAAFLTLVDEGRVRLRDPITKYLAFPSSVSTGGKRKRAAIATPTLRHLLAMTAGVGYDDHPGYKGAMAQVKRGAIADLEGLCKAITGEALAFQPGRRYCYSFCTDVLGHICELASGQSIDVFVAQRLLKPLRMRDTYFAQCVPARKRRRLAKLCVSRKSRSGSFSLQPWTGKACAIKSCGGGVVSYADYGMVSTARDYARFCQMLLDGGISPDGRRVLRQATVRALWCDGLAPYQGRGGRLAGWNDADGRDTSYWDYMGWSLLNAHLVFHEAPRKGRPRRGRCMWMGGGGGAYWHVDAQRGLVAVSFAPVFGGRSSEGDGLGPLANDASPFAREAVDEGAGPLKRRRSRSQ